MKSNRIDQKTELVARATTFHKNGKIFIFEKQRMHLAFNVEFRSLRIEV